MSLVEGGNVRQLRSGKHVVSLERVRDWKRWDTLEDRDWSENHHLPVSALHLGDCVLRFPLCLNLFSRTLHPLTPGTFALHAVETQEILVMYLKSRSKPALKIIHFSLISESYFYLAINTFFSVWIMNHHFMVCLHFTCWWCSSLLQSPWWGELAEPRVSCTHPWAGAPPKSCSVPLHPLYWPQKVLWCL